MNATVKESSLMARKDHEGMILDLLDDIVRAEAHAKALVDRLDSISKRPGFRIIDIEMHIWIVASIAIVACIIGMITGYALHGLLHG